ncbi:MAG: hypothetical protein M0009_05260 [Deltaproteobacteria bacterium]|nr:hypothetical protein [Deltaproteobacteria bacterium]
MDLRGMQGQGNRNSPLSYQSGIVSITAGWRPVRPDNPGAPSRQADSSFYLQKTATSHVCRSINPRDDSVAGKSLNKNTTLSDNMQKASNMMPIRFRNHFGTVDAIPVSAKHVVYQTGQGIFGNGSDDT